MQLSLYSDYALRLLMRLAVEPDRLVTIQEVSDSYGISRNHLMKIAYALGQHGFITTLRGRRGGLKLAHPPEQIGLGGVVRATEDSLTLVECFNAETNSCVLAPCCQLKGILGEALEAFLAVLDRYSLADLVRQPDLLRACMIPPLAIKEEALHGQHDPRQV